MLWKLGRVMEIISGRDTIARVCKLRMTDKQGFTHLVQLLYLLEKCTGTLPAAREDVAIQGVVEKEARGTRNAARGIETQK